MESLFLGEGIEISTDSMQTQLNNNILVVGPSGSGKTMSYAEMRLLCTKESSPTFSDVLGLFSTLRIVDKGDTIETNLDIVFDRLEKDEPGHFAFQCWKTFRFSPLRTASCIYSTLSAAMDTIFSPELKTAMSGRQSANFKETANRKTVLFVTTSAVNPSLNAFAGIIYSHAVKELFEYAESKEDGVLPVPVHLLCDDFAVGAQIPNFAQYISIFREKHISVSILLQSESQLKGMYGGNDATTIINNCDRYIYMGGMDLATCKSIAERMNQPLSDILYMPLGQEIVFERGSRPVVTTRWKITENTQWLQLEKMYTA